PVKIPKGFFMDHLRSVLSKSEIQVLGKDLLKVQFYEILKLQETHKGIGKELNEESLNKRLQEILSHKMYDLERQYKLNLDELQCNSYSSNAENLINGNSINSFLLRAKDYLKKTELRKVYSKQVLDPESMLNQIKLQDYLMFLMLKKLFGENNNMFQENDSLTEIPFPCDMHYEDDESENGYTRNKYLKGAIDVEYAIISKDNDFDYKYTVKAKICADRYGDFRHLLKDGRLVQIINLKDKPKQLSGMLPLFLGNTGVIEWDELRELLIQFESKRIDLLSLVYKIEESLCKKISEAKINERINTGKHFSFNDILKLSDNKLKEEEKELIREIRNACMHNRIPMIDKFISHNKKENKLTDVFSDYLNAIDDFLNNLVNTIK
ncbi:MAG: hypothetical protein ACEPOW_06795, partial [Bacteroidales bacterium]